VSLRNSRNWIYVAKDCVFLRNTVKIAIRFGFYKRNGFLYQPNNYKLFKDDPVFIGDLYVCIV